MRKSALLLFMFMLFNTISAGNWPGNAIVGNGRFCAVYSEDARVTAKDRSRGIRHFYWNDFTADYISSAYFELITKSMMVQTEKTEPFMTDFFTPSANHFRGNSLVFTTSVRAGKIGLLMRFEPKKEKLLPVLKINFNDKLTGDTNRHLVELSAGEKGDAFALWSNNVRIRLVATVPYKAIKKSDNSLELQFITDGAFEVMFMPDLYSNKNNGGTAQTDKSGVITRLKPVKMNTAWQDASKNWNKWIEEGGFPFAEKSVVEQSGKISAEEKKNYNDYYSRNLYAAYSSIINGQVPADVTGQFLTNGMPQLYPRDAMMTARNFLQCGYTGVAAEIIRFWGRESLQQKSPGEFFARYDSYSRATDAGEGARYDEPEWDASGYFIILNYEYYKQTSEWLTPPEKLFAYADFIVKSIDSTGLLYEGGIVEWTGYLPATNMICAAGLLTATEIAKELNKAEQAERYKSAYKTIESSLPQLFDKKRDLYVARRYYGIKADNNFSIPEKKGDLLYLWDVTTVFGILWGYPDHPMMHQTYRYIKENLNDNGGVRYFEATDNGWLEAYGKDLFYFATAGWAKYAIMQKDYEFAQKNLTWIINQSNVYGLMPERVLSDYLGISEASPLTWGCSEFAGAIKMYAQP